MPVRGTALMGRRCMHTLSAGGRRATSAAMASLAGRVVGSPRLSMRAARSWRFGSAADAGTKAILAWTSMMPGDSRTPANAARIHGVRTACSQGDLNITRSVWKLPAGFCHSSAAQPTGPTEERSEEDGERSDRPPDSDRYMWVATFISVFFASVGVRAFLLPGAVSARLMFKS